MPHGTGEFVVEAGSLRHQLVIEQMVLTDDGGGGHTESATTFATVMGHLRPASAREVENARMIKLSVTHVVTIRFLTGLKSSMRIKFGTRIFGIRGVRNIDERIRKHVLQCEEMLELD